MSIATILSSSQAFAEPKFTYEINKNRFTSKPTVCVLEMYEPSISDSKIKAIMDETKNGVYDWIISLQQETSFKSIWDIGYVEIPARERASFDFSSCDTIIHFRDGKNIKDLGNHHYVDGTSHITIYYDICNSGTKDCSEDNLVKIMGATVRHEFGHALGLGHYRTDGYQIKKLMVGNDLPPSIMLEYSKTKGEEKITTIDINKVQEIYSDSGFTIPHLPKPRFVMPSALVPITPEKLDITNSEVSGAKTNSVLISGYFDVVKYTKIVELTIIRPDTKIINAKAPIQQNGYFEYEFDFHSKLPQGIYFVQAKYGKNLSEKNTIQLS
jgi:hypothetical protein